jgi:hypothetical protein
LVEAFRDLPEVERLDVSAAEGDYQRLALTPRNGADLRPLVFEVVQQHHWALRELTRSRHTLEDIFVHLTRSQHHDK